MSLHNEDLFDASVDDATHAVITAFEWLDLPEGDALGDLMVRINDTLAAIMSDYHTPAE